MTRRMPDLGRTDPACPANRHGTAAAYSRAGCRCPEARAANSARKRSYYLGTAEPALIDSLGSRRRLQSLFADGWRWTDLAGRLDTYAKTVTYLAYRAQPTVLAATAERITALYDELRSTRGPSAFARTRGAKNGWLPPAAWEGADIDDPAAAPEPPIEEDVEIVATKDRPCRDVDPDLFYADSPAETECAKRVCLSCVRRLECLQGALDRAEEWGVYGGTDPDERRAMLRSHGRPTSVFELDLVMRRTQVVKLAKKLPLREVARQLGVALHTVQRDLEAAA